MRGKPSGAARAAGDPLDGRGVGSLERATRAQRLIARRMVEAKAGVPEFTVAVDVAMDAALALRERLRVAAGEGGGVAPSVNDMVVRACALALRAHPRVNASWDEAGGGVRCWQRVNVGIAVATDGALLVPTIHDADGKSLARIAAEARALVAAVRERTITPARLADGTFTVSNLGMLGVRHFEAVINPPQAAILAVGALRPVALPRPSGEIAAVQQLTLTLTSDHRIVYGADAAGFLATVRELLEDPERLVD